MTDLKVGDEVYYFHDADFDESFIVDDVSVKNSSIKKLHDNNTIEIEDHKRLWRCEAFKSKNEAIDALVKHLENLKDK